MTRKFKTAIFWSSPEHSIWSKSSNPTKDTKFCVYLEEFTTVCMPGVGYMRKVRNRDIFGLSTTKQWNFALE